MMIMLKTVLLVLDLEVIGREVLEAIFATLTNVNFSAARIGELIAELQAFKTEFRYECACLAHHRC